MFSVADSGQGIGEDQAGEEPLLVDDASPDPEEDEWELDQLDLDRTPDPLGTDGWAYGEDGDGEDLDAFEASLIETTSAVDKLEREAGVLRPNFQSMEADPSWVEIFERDPEYTFGDEDAGLWIFDETKAAIVGIPMSSGLTQDGLTTECAFGYEGVRVDFQVVQWQDGSGEIRCTDVSNGGLHLNRLRHGGRIGFYRLPDGRFWAELRIMREGRRGFATAHNPEDGEWVKVLGWPLEETLIGVLEADATGTRADVLGDISGRRFTPVVTWRDSSVHVPAFLYVATRILPLMQLDGDYVSD